jgi:glycosyltransferase involved in cell wall biosynthesis
MRIARILTRLNLGGPARQVLASDPLLLAGGHEIRLFAGRPEPGEGDLCERAKERGIDVRRIKSLARGLNPLRDLKGRSELAHELAAFDPDVIHTHAAKAGALGRSAGWVATRAPLVHTFHGHVLEGYFPRVVSRRMAAFERGWARRCSRVIAVSERTAEDLVRLDVVERREVEVVPPGIELDEFARLSSLAEPACLRKREARGALELDPSAFVVLFLGRLAPIKRPTLALAARAPPGGDARCRTPARCRRGRAPAPRGLGRLSVEFSQRRAPGRADRGSRGGATVSGDRCGGDP